MIERANTLTGLHVAINFIIVLLLVAIIICFALLVNVHASDYLRERKQNKRKQLLFAIIERYRQGEDVVADIIKYRTRAGVAVLIQVLAECDEDTVALLQKLIREAGFEAYIKRQLESGDVAYCTLLIKLIGELRLLGFSDFIADFLYRYKKGANLQYVGFLTLSLLGDADTLIPICLDDNFTQSLSFRSLKEIFKHFDGDRVALCEALLKAPDNYIRRVALNMVAEDSLAPLAPNAMKLLHQLDINIVIDAVRALGQIGYEPAVPELLQLSGHERWEVRNAVVHALAAINLEKYAPYIAKGLSDKEWWVRYNAAAALAGYSRVKELQQAPAVLNDRFATEILQYAIQRKALQREVRTA